MKKKTQTKRKNIKDAYETTTRRDFFLQKEKRREIHDNNYKKKREHKFTRTHVHLIVEINVL